MRLYAASGILAAGLSITLAPADEADRDRNLADLASALGDNAFAELRHEGEGLSLERAIRVALDASPA